VAVDLATPDGPGLLVQHALDEHGRVDVLVNNVGAVRIRLEGFLGTSDEEFEWAMRMNFFTALRAIRAAIPSMVEQVAGRSSTSPQSTRSSSPTQARSQPSQALCTSAGFWVLAAVEVAHDPRRGQVLVK
jgi:NAD(P)-dependent dehydrogenase (short-subunit alcohol dehydrogenase family)